MDGEPGSQPVRTGTNIDPLRFNHVLDKLMLYGLETGSSSSLIYLLILTVSLFLGSLTWYASKYMFHTTVHANTSSIGSVTSMLCVCIIFSASAHQISNLPNPQWIFMPHNLVFISLRPLSNLQQ